MLPGQVVITAPVSVTIGYFNTLDITKVLDVDNMCKPILDALQGLIYTNDAQVIDALPYKRNTNELNLTDVSYILLNAIANLTPFVYIKVELADRGRIPKISY